MDIGSKLSIADIVLSVVGFTITVIAAIRARNAAEAARQAAADATQKMLRVDLISEIATVVQLLEELKRLQRTKAIELLPDRYSNLRSRVVSIRESAFVQTELDMSTLQDVVVRIASLEKGLDRGANNFNEPKQIARCNQSLSTCIDALLALKERVRTS